LEKAFAFRGTLLYPQIAPIFIFLLFGNYECLNPTGVSFRLCLVGRLDLRRCI